ncbi:MAG TPA: hypothetical protein ENK06_04685 [Gammaproteobacteria bacterium]|nr:hypothetical protein [Gammaproteobacteria bacterium]
MSFNILREMEPFTQRLFNEIIGFQERDHPAWDESQAFEKRIANLPLHYLIFSNADRNPETHGPTVAHYYPLQKEMQTITDYAKQVADKPVVLDVHARNGFIGSLLAREGLDVIGLRDGKEKPNQIENFYDKTCYRMENRCLSDIDFPVDVLFSSWMPSTVDITEDVVRLNPKLVVYVFTKHINEYSGERQTGTSQSFGEKLPASYKIVDEWEVTRIENLLNEIWPDLSPNIEEKRFVRIYANTGFHDIKINDNRPPAKGYDWEKELLMAETAHEAKKTMKERGFPING